MSNTVPRRQLASALLKSAARTFSDAGAPQGIVAGSGGCVSRKHLPAPQTPAADLATRLLTRSKATTGYEADD